jgi:hypothetical protein
MLWAALTAVRRGSIGLCVYEQWLVGSDGGDHDHGRCATQGVLDPALRRADGAIANGFPNARVIRNHTEHDGWQDRVNVSDVTAPERREGPLVGHGRDDLPHAAAGPPLPNLQQVETGTTAAVRQGFLHPRADADVCGLPDCRPRNERRGGLVCPMLRPMQARWRSSRCPFWDQPVARQPSADHQQGHQERHDQG